MMLSDDDLAVIFMDSFLKMENKKKRAIINLFDKPSDILTAKVDDFSKAVDRPTAKLVADAVGNEKFRREAIDGALKGADDAIAFCSERYPEELLNTPAPPLVLYAKGNVGLLKEDKVAIVGSRKTLPQYERATEDVAEGISQSAVVVTGIADGGDSAAIRGAMKRGRAISVLASGLDSVSPKSKEGLIADLIRAGGLVLSEYPSGITARKFSFPLRNRIIAGLSKGVLVVSGEEDSGARLTAAYAVDYGREVMCFPYSFGVKSGELCIKLVKEGAKLVDSAKDVSDILGFETKAEKEIPLTPEERLVYELIAEGVNYTDKLVERSGLKIYQLAPITAMLEVKGIIVKDVTGRFDITKRI